MSDFGTENRKIWDQYVAAAIPVAHKVYGSEPDHIAKFAAEIADALMAVREQRVEEFKRQSSQGMDAAWGVVSGE